MVETTMSFFEDIIEINGKTSTSYLLPFEKMHGLGNDFVIVNASHLYEHNDTTNRVNNKTPVDYRTAQEKELARKICDRNLGVGADGLIIIDSVKDSQEAVRLWRYYNSDGSVGEMCGNGIRCAAKYIYEHGLSGEDTQFKIETLVGDIGVELLDDDLVKVNMGPPKEIKEDLSLSIGNFKFNYDYVSMGNPHAVAFFNDFDTQQLQSVSKHGPTIEVHSNFPNKTNVEFARVVMHNAAMRQIHGHWIELIVWERGCGFTRACGTGACATVVSAIQKGFCKKGEDITVKLPGGDLIISWDSVTADVFMTGPAVLSFVGYYNDELVR